MIEQLDKIMASFTEIMWSMPLVIAIISAGIYFTFYSKLVPFRYLGHAVDILRGNYDSENDPGQITHFEALSSALASTVGMGNIAGVAIAIHTGGPGVVFWLWVSAILGMGTKFFTCTLSILFRGKDDQGRIQGGPMYFIESGLGKKFKPLALFFSVAGMFGCLTFFQANQLAQIIRDFIYQPLNVFQNSQMTGDGITGIIVAVIVGIVIFGGIKRIAKVASKLVPFMVGIYFIAALIILGKNITEIPQLFFLILKDAFTGDAVLGGALGTLIITGVKRGVFSNEAGTGTEAMAHGAAKTDEPIREGLVAMLGPFIDTIIVCSVTAFVILISGLYESEDTGVTLTAMAFEKELGIVGKIFLIIAVLNFSLTTMFGYSYYGRKCAGYIFGTPSKTIYNCFYICMIVVASVVSLDIAINFVDGMFALMVIPTLVSTILLSPKVMSEAKRYFSQFN
jgi:AGCS family alanine or glycine:cation symporter